jgi:predicted DNA-binding protein
MGRPAIGQPTPIRLPDDMKARLEAVSEASGLPVAALVRRAVARWLEDTAHIYGSADEPSRRHQIAAASAGTAPDTTP